MWTIFATNPLGNGFGFNGDLFETNILNLAVVLGLVPEVRSGVPVAAELTVDLELRALVLQVLVDAVEGAHLLTAAKALDLEALAFRLDVGFKVL